MVSNKMFCNIKKGGLYLFILLFFVAFVNAFSATSELRIGGSIDLSGRNVTLVALDAKEDKMIVCVNGERSIIPEWGKTVKEVLIEPRKITSYYAEIRLKTAEDGSCGPECSNEVCFRGKTTPIEKPTTTTTTTTTLVEKEMIVKEETILTGEVVKKGSKVPMTSLVLLGLVLIIGFLVVLKRR